jgi:hypothetical protein
MPLIPATIGNAALSGALAERLGDRVDRYSLWIAN